MIARVVWVSLLLGLASSEKGCALSGVHVTLGDHFTHRDSDILYRVGVLTYNEDCVDRVDLLYEGGGRELSFKVSRQRRYEDSSLDYVRVFLFFELRGIPNGSDFRYSLRVDGVVRKGPFEFRSAVQSGQVKLAVFADHDLEKGQAVLAHLKEKTYDALLVLGDIAYDIQDRKGLVGDEYFEAIEPVVTTRPYIFVPGNHENHDSSRMLNYRFVYPGCVDPMDNNLFAFRLGNLLFFAANFDHFLEIQADRYMPQLTGLQRLIEIYSKKFPDHARIFVSHRPIYRADLRDDKIESLSLIYRLKPFEELLIQSGVKLYLFAHQHSYERYYSMHNYEMLKDRSDAIVIVGTGGNKENIEGYPYEQPFVREKIFKTDGVLALQNFEDRISLAFVEAISGKLRDPYDVLLDEGQRTKGRWVLTGLGILGISVAAIGAAFFYRRANPAKAYRI